MPGERGGGVCELPIWSHIHTVPSHRFGGVEISLSNVKVSLPLVSWIIPVQKEGCLFVCSRQQQHTGRRRRSSRTPTSTGVSQWTQAKLMAVTTLPCLQQLANVSHNLLMFPTASQHLPPAIACLSQLAPSCQHWPPQRANICDG